MNIIYKDYLRLVLIAYEKETPFYMNLGSEIRNEKTPMSILHCGHRQILTARKKKW